MSLEEIPSIYELEAAASAPRHICTEELPYISVEKCSGGHRQSIFEYLTGDTTLEDEFFRRRTLSLGDFDGTRKIASPIPREEPRRTPVRDSIEAPLTPRSANGCAPRPRYYDWDYGSTPSKFELVDEHGREMWFGDEESIKDDHSYMLPEQLEDLIEPHGKIDPELQIKTAGPLEIPLVTANDITERALVPSIRGEVCSASTPELTRDDSDEEDTVGPGFDASPASLHFFGQAGAHVTTRELQDDFVAAQVTELAGGYLDIDQASQLEHDRINSDFFHISNAETFSRSLEAASPTGTVRIRGKSDAKPTSESQQYLLPSVYDDLADEDYYLGPDTKAPVGPFSQSSPSISDERTPSVDENMLPAPLKYLLHKPRKPQHNDLSTHAFEEPDTASTIRGVALNQLFVPQNEQPVRQTVTKASIANPEFTVAEAPFRNSALMQRRNGKPNLIRKRKAEDHEIESTSKRIRHTFINKNSSRIKAHTSCLSEARSIAAIRETSKTFSKASLLSHLLTSPMPQALRGFTGQFNLPIPSHLPPTTPPTRNFGNPSHPNGLITHTNFTPDTRHTPDLTEHDINHDATLLHLTQHAEIQSSHSANLHFFRTRAENELRKEAHRECTLARLEGVCVGYYRYFLGHMTVEEYVEAGMCVCWDECVCNKFCTRFGDLRCPCSGWVVLSEEGEDG
ncbi:hypothetical protein OHC33_003329 [Knufia fluminis]|uniref:Uncharacterized protein n=1 Tax=Knufia fluminis TaxID=191047 RepID=A0AAN8EP27_9EURO|nr:hypothetical protein OHC33_003329 [Knufia fluminis]